VSVRGEDPGPIRLMQDDNHDLRVSARSARLTAGLDGGEGPPYRFGGIAVAAGDILHMADGTRVLMTAEELQKAAETQAGEPLTKDHPEDSKGRPMYPPEVDETFGKVAKAGWVESQQVVGYEATTHDEDLAAGIQGGSLDVSVHPFFDTEPHDGPEADVVATNIKFGDLSVVSKGNSPSASAEWGPNQAIASWTESADIGAELTAADSTGDGDGDHQGLIASTVRGTLQALGLQPDELAAADGSTEESTTEAESSTDNGSNPDMDRDDIISSLSDDYDFNEDWLEDQEDEDLEHLHESIVEGDDGDSTDTSGDGAGADTTDGADGPAVTFETEEEFNEAVDARLEEQADELVQEAQARASKAEKVDEIVAKSDEFDEDDREELLASADKIVDREYKRVRGELAASFPGTAGAAGQLTASAGGSDELDEYGTGVQGQGGDDS